MAEQGGRNLITISRHAPRDSRINTAGGGGAAIVSISHVRLTTYGFGGGGGPTLAKEP